MKIPSFHDGFFDGFRLDSNKSLRISKNLLRSVQAKKLQILELNPSYGAQGLILFETCRIKED
jgi:hypothetical protein